MREGKEAEEGRRKICNVGGTGRGREWEVWTRLSERNWETGVLKHGVFATETVVHTNL